MNVVVDNFPTDMGTVVNLNLPPLVDVTDRPDRQAGHVTVDNLPATQAVSGTVAVSNLPSVQSVVGSVAVSNFPAIQPVTGNFFPPTQPVSGSVAVSNFPASQPVTGNFFPATQPVSGVVSVIPLARTQIMLSWERLAGTAAESALVNFTNGTKAGLALPAATSYAVTAGKTLRITSVNINAVATNGTIFNSRLRLRQAAAVLNTSPIIWQAEVGMGSSTTNNQTSAASTSFPIPDGLEIPAG